MARNFSDPEVQEAIKDLPYKVVENNGRFAIEIVTNEENKVVTPEEVLGIILQHLVCTFQEHGSCSVPCNLGSNPFIGLSNSRQLLLISILHMIYPKALTILRVPNYADFEVLSSEINGGSSSQLDNHSCSHKRSL